MRQSRAVLLLSLASFAIESTSSFQSFSHLAGNQKNRTWKTSYPSCVTMKSVTPFHRLAPGLVERPQKILGLSATVPLAQCIGAVGSTLSSVQAYLFHDQTFVLSAVVLLANFGLVMERKTAVGRVLSANIATMALALFCSNVGLMPLSSPIYAMVNKKLVPLAVALLLFDSDLRRVIRDTGSLFLCFLVGAFATVLGTLIAYPLIPMTSLGNNEGWKIASALAARHIGGAVNFISVAETLGVSSSSVSAAVAADNVVIALYFTWLFYSSTDGEGSSSAKDMAHASQAIITTDDNRIIGEAAVEDKSGAKQNISLMSMSISLAVSTTLLFLGTLLTDVFLPVGTSVLPLVSLCTVAAATTFSNFFSQLSTTSTAMGIIFIQMFFAVSGAAGSIRSVIQKAPSLLLFSLLQIFIHFVTLMGIGKFVLKLEQKELYIASNANVGGPTTAAAMAQAKNWKRLVMPGLLVGIFGYATATPLSLVLGRLLCAIGQKIT